MDLKGRNFLTLKDFTPAEIAYLLDLSAELKEKKKELNSQIEEAQKERLYKAVAESGRSIEEILEMLSKEDSE